MLQHHRPRPRPRPRLGWHPRPGFDRPLSLEGLLVACANPNRRDLKLLAVVLALCCLEGNHAALSWTPIARTWDRRYRSRSNAEPDFSDDDGNLQRYQFYVIHLLLECDSFALISAFVSAKDFFTVAAAVSIQWLQR